MLRVLIALVLSLVPFSQALAQTPTEQDMPVMVLYCDSDPGGVEVGGGKEPAPEQLIESGQCTPAEGVALTFVLVRDDFNFETSEPTDDWNVTGDSWFARCDMDADGRCTTTSPNGFEVVLGVFLHDATVKPGYEPANFRRTTQNVTEFTGYGLALVPTADDSDTVGDVADHQTLALSITQDGAPANVLTEWDVDSDNGSDDANDDHGSDDANDDHGTDDANDDHGSDDANDDNHDQYLATNSDGWVSAVTAPSQKVNIDLVNVHDSAHITATCSANDDPAATITVDLDNDDAELEITLPDTTSDVRCDVEIMEHAS